MSQTLDDGIRGTRLVGLELNVVAEIATHVGQPVAEKRIERCGNERPSGLDTKRTASKGVAEDCFINIARSGASTFAAPGSKLDEL